LQVPRRDDNISSLQTLGKREMAEPYLGQVCSFGFTFAPINWALCQGQLLSIGQNDALFALLGTTYGGDGQSTFGLPNLQGRVPINQGQGSSLSPYVLGQQSGSESITLTSLQLPIHNHLVATSNTPGTTNVPSTGTFLSDEGPGTPAVTTYTPGTPPTQTALAGTTISPSGSSLPHENRQPFLAVNFCIALAGIFPPQS
jgi:microcystin-dependent protein